MTRDPARRAAYDTLRAVAERDAYANLTLPRLLRERGLDGRDAAFATELGYGTLRRQGSLDAVLAGCASRPLDRVDSPVLTALRLGAYQLLHLRVPAHAAVSASVELAPPPGRGFANAVLRRVAERSWAEWLDRLRPADPVDRLALEHAHPAWVVRAFAAALGGDLAETAQLLAADDAPQSVHLLARPGRIEPAELLAEAGPGARAGRFSPYAVQLGGGAPGRLPAVRRRAAVVQDEGSQLVALALAAAPLAGPDARWLDCAAGPGGKAALLADLAAARAARLLAADLARHRARLARRLLAGGPADVLVADARRPPWAPGRFDRVLLDAPCSGLGALRRRPEARWRRRPEDVARLAALQQELLERSLDALRPGGVLGYVTCSPHPAETVEVVAAVRRRRDDVALVDARPLLPGVPDLGPGPQVQLWPHRHGTDAMFLALLRRVR